MELFNDVYRNKRVLVTGHSGFKGSWLSLWLKSLGAEVFGISAYFPSQPNNFTVCDLGSKIRHHEGEIRDLAGLKKLFSDIDPEIVFHLAAQPIVRVSYDNPKDTFDINVGGTVNVLECIRGSKNVKAAVMITSDKCYKNVEWNWGYRENDALGGDDPYSASKGCAEIVINSYIKSFFKGDGSTRIASVRAGNVIGGGDWADSRIVPDCMKAWSKNEILTCRSPEATRPWQHVLEPLGGYLMVGADLFTSSKLAGESFNFGPDAKVNQTVGELIVELGKIWGTDAWKFQNDSSAKKESGLLKLSCDKVLAKLGWFALLNFQETVNFTGEWYKSYYLGKQNMYEFTISQLNMYTQLAKERNLPWITG